MDYTLLKEEDEINLIRLLYNFQNAVIDALEKYEPSFVTRHVVEIAKAFNKFYNSCPILSVEEGLKKLD